LKLTEVIMFKNSDPANDVRPETAGIDRRAFLAATTGLAASSLLAKGPAAAMPPAGLAPSPAAAIGPLAMNGGTPVRATLLHAKNPGVQYYDEEERREVLDVIEIRSPFRWSRFDGKGLPPKAIGFEKEFAAHQGTQYCLGVTSGTTALIAALAGLAIGPGDEVILPAWTWYACYDAILFHGALPVFAEIDRSMDIDPTDIERHITPNTKVIMTVNIQGEPSDLDAITAIAKKHNLKILEDSAQCVGGVYKGRRVGSIGDVGIYSFQESKTITAGEGGAVVTSDPLIFERAVRFHDVGMLRKGHIDWLGQPPQLKQTAGGNFRMNEFTAGIMCAQVRKLDRILADQRDKQTRVLAGIADLPGLELRKKNVPVGGTGSRILIWTESKEQRDLFVTAMRAENVAAGPSSGSALLPIVPHIEAKQGLEEGWPSFSTPHGKEITYGAQCCPKTQEILDRYVEIYMDPKFSDQDVNDVVAAVRKVYMGVVRS
jgi:8-amino-3,8-dideoxy-alpha-D-manno-octulosonate transaminase